MVDDDDGPSTIHYSQQTTPTNTRTTHKQNIKSNHHPKHDHPPTKNKQVCHTCTPGHPYSRFAWGNLQSLRDEPKAAGVDINAELRAFHEKYYVASVRFFLWVVWVDGCMPMNEDAGTSSGLTSNLPVYQSRHGQNMKLVVLGMEDLDAQEATVCRVFRCAPPLHFSNPVQKRRRGMNKTAPLLGCM